MIRSILDGEHVVLTILDEESDSAEISRWTHDVDYLLATDEKPVRPLSPPQVKKQIQEWNKKKENQTPFAVRSRSDDQLIGYVLLRWIDWAHGNAFLQVFPAAPVAEHLDSAREALDLLVRYSFRELNMYRVTVQVAEYLPSILDIYLRAGFQEEVRRRQSLLRFGRRWDMIHLGLLAEEWRERTPVEGEVQ